MPPPRKTVEKARVLRRALTPPEIALWQYLRTRPGGLRFRRQHPVGPYVLDLYCPSAKLAIEIDGAAHDFGDRPVRDAGRDAWLLERGIDTLRIPAADVFANFEAVTQLILSRCAISPPPASPVPLPIF